MIGLTRMEQQACTAPFACEEDARTSLLSMCSKPLETEPDVFFGRKWMEFKVRSVSPALDVASIPDNFPIATSGWQVRVPLRRAPRLWSYSIHRLFISRLQTKNG